MKNNYLEVFKTLEKHLLNYPNTKDDVQYLLKITQKQIQKIKTLDDDKFEPEKLSRQDVFKLARGYEISSRTARTKVKVEKISKVIDELINKHSDCKRDYEQLGFKPIVEQTEGQKGAGNKTLIWLNIQSTVNKENIKDENQITIENNEEENSQHKFKYITYERAETGSIKRSILGRIFLKDGKLVMRSFKGYLLMISLVLSLFFNIYLLINVILTILFIDDIPNLTFWHAFFVVALLIEIPLVWYYFYKPIISLPINRVIKDPDLFMSHFNTYDTDLELYCDNSKNKVLHLTYFTATCPICESPIDLQYGKPDHNLPLVGRCKEAPHAHVYTFDRMTMKGYFLGHDGYLQNN